MNKRKTGSEYEDIACKYLEEKGYFIIERNFRCRIGEIDIIARDNNYLTFVEVKYRKNNASGMPYEAVGAGKQKTIRNVAAVYMKYNNFGFDTPCRFDVVSILGKDITLYKNAFGSI